MSAWVRAAYRPLTPLRRALQARRGAASRCGALRLAQHPAQHVRQQPAVPVVLDVVRRIDARHRLERLRTTVLRPRAHRETLPGSEPWGDALDAVGLPAGEPERRRR